MEHRGTPVYAHDHMFQGKLYSLGDKCFNCGYRLGMHKGGDVGECPLDESYRYHDKDYFTTRGTAFILFPAVLEVPRGA